MKIVDAGYEILDTLNGEEILKKIERVARVCYKSEDKITEGSAEKMVRALIKSNHMAMLEHYSFSVKFICDRGVSHEIVRHRVASYAQESTRYCNYNKSGDVAFIRPVFFEEDTPEMDNWLDSCMRAEKTYNYLISEGRTPQEARSVLPNSLKTEVVMTANLREWRHFLSLRACGSTGKPHPQMLEVAGLLKLVFILCTIAVVGLSVVDTLWFNAMPESNRYKNVQAFNVVTLWIVAIVLIIKLVTM